MQVSPDSPRPPSASHFGFACAALVAGLGVLFLLQARDPGHAGRNALAACAVIAFLIAGFDLFVGQVHRRASAGLGTFQPGQVSLPRVLTKLLGLAVTLGLIAAGYWLFPEYHGSFYEPFWNVLRALGPWLAIAAVPYFCWVDGMQQQPGDAYAHLGRVVLLRETPDGKLLANHFRGWLVKAFFMPLMVVYLAQQTDAATQAFHLAWATGNIAIYDFAYNGLFLVDLMFCVIGYALTLRVLDSHIRSAEPTLFGWAVALVCYQPFWSLVSTDYLRYDDDLYWGAWLSGHPFLQAAWASAIIALLLVYSLCTVAFGLRFSNLTHRGIITAGPYRWFRHPAYLSKNLSWWLISIPFISHQGLPEALRNCALLGLLNGIYYLRAQTEERHLGADPDYVAYSGWIGRNGPLARLRWRPRPAG